MSRIIVNGQEQNPAKKVKLFKHKKLSEIQELIKNKRNEQSSNNNN